MWSRPWAIVTSIKWDVKVESSFTTMWSFHCKRKSYVQIGASLLKFSRTEDEAELRNRRRLTSTRREALSLYRDILRASRFFTWTDLWGFLLRDILRENAWKEFEAARFETDPEIVTRLLLGGQDAVESALEKLSEKHRQEIEKERREGGDRRWLLTFCAFWSWFRSLYFCICNCNCNWNWNFLLLVEKWGIGSFTCNCITVAVHIILVELNYGIWIGKKGLNFVFRDFE